MRKSHEHRVMGKTYPMAGERPKQPKTSGTGAAQENKALAYDNWFTKPNQKEREKKKMGCSKPPWPKNATKKRRREKTSTTTTSLFPGNYGQLQQKDKDKKPADGSVVQRWRKRGEKKRQGPHNGSNNTKVRGGGKWKRGLPNRWRKTERPPGKLQGGRGCSA